MSTHSATPPFTDDGPGEPADPLARLFADARCRTLLRVLAADERPVELDDLTARVLAAETDEDEAAAGTATAEAAAEPARFDRTLVSLYRCKLPLFVAAELVELDEDDGVVVAPDAAAIRRLL